MTEQHTSIRKFEPESEFHTSFRTDGNAALDWSRSNFPPLELVGGKEARNGRADEADIAAKATELPDRERGWIAGMGRQGQSAEIRELLDAFVGNRSELLRKVVELGLPHIPFQSVPVDDFVRDPKSALGELRGEKFYAMVHPTDANPGLEWPTAVVGTPRELAKELLPYSSSAQEHPYTVVVSELADIKYLAAIAVDGGNQLRGEFNPAPLPPTRSNVTPEFHFYKQPFTGTMRYSFDDPNLRVAISQAVTAIPHEGEGRDAVYRPGYYEAYIVERPSGAYAAAFYDVRDSKAFAHVGDLPTSPGRAK